MRTAILAKIAIEETTRTVTQSVGFVEMPDGNVLDSIYKALNCEMIDVVYFNGFEAFVDDEGLLKSGNPVVEYISEGFEIPLAGNLLFAKGVDAEGETIWFDLEKDMDVINEINELLNTSTFKGVTK